MMPKHGLYAPSDEAREAGDYFNSLPFEDRKKLAPLLEHYRQMGIAEVCAQLDRTRNYFAYRVNGIREAKIEEALA